MINSISQAFFYIKIQPNESEQKKKRQRIYHLFNGETKPKFIVKSIQNKEKNFAEK